MELAVVAVKLAVVAVEIKKSKHFLTNGLYCLLGGVYSTFTVNMNYTATVLSIMSL